MFCMNCGKTVADDERFCQNCGWPVGQNAGQGNGDDAKDPGFEPNTPVTDQRPGDGGYGAAPQGMSPGTMAPSPKKKLVKVLIPVLAVAATVAILVFSGLASRAVNLFKKTFSSPESYFQEVMKSALQDEAKTLANLYNSMIREPLNVKDQSVSGKITAKLGDDVRKLLETVGYPEDLDWLKEVSLAVDLSSKNNAFSGNAALALGQNELISGNAICDVNGGKAYVQVPILSGKYLGADLGDAYYGYRELTQAMEKLNAIYEAFPDKAVVERLIYKYYSLAIDCVKNVDRSDETLTAGGVSQKCTALRTVITTDTMKDMTRAVLKEMRNDQELKTLIETMYKMNMQINQGYSAADYDHEGWIDAALENVDNIQMNSELTMKIYVDGEGEIIGTKAEVEGTSIYGVRLQKGGNVGYEVSCESPYEGNFSLVGTGKQSGDTENVDFELNTGTSDLDKIRFRVKDLDRKAYKAGNFKGTIIIPLEEFDNMMGDAALLLRQYDVALALDWGEAEKKVGLSLLLGDGEVASIEYAFKMGPGKEISIPSGGETILVEDQYDLAEWARTADLDRFMDQLKKTEIPSDIITGLENTLKMYMSYIGAR